MEPTAHIHLGKDRRIAIPAQFCKEAHPRAGIVSSCPDKEAISYSPPLEEEADRMRQELRAMRGDSVNERIRPCQMQPNKN